MTGDPRPQLDPAEAKARLREFAELTGADRPAPARNRAERRARGHRGPLVPPASRRGEG